jgi:hypothetical protein
MDFFLFCLLCIFGALQFVLHPLSLLRWRTRFSRFKFLTIDLINKYELLYLMYKYELLYLMYYFL